MTINYKKELEAAAKGMILVHEPNVLIKMIVRTIVQKVKVSHAGIMLHEKEQDSYILTVSRGPSGLKIPAGFARIDRDNPIIRFLSKPGRNEKFRVDMFVYEELNKVLKRKIPEATKELLRKILYQMEIFEAAVCIPTYFREELLGVLLLGKKKNGRPIVDEELDFFSALTSDVAMAIRNARLFHDLELELDRKQRLFINTTYALAAAIEAKDHYTRGHTARVTELSLVLARRLAKKNRKIFTPEFLERLRIAGLLHDIGKIGVPESILNKQGELTGEERKKMQQHALAGATILAPITELDYSVQGVKYHHERYDGSGYPEGLKGEQIPLVAAIISVADTFDAMTTDRPYRRALSKQQAAQEIRRMSGKQFNPRVTETFAELYQEGKI